MAIRTDTLILMLTIMGTSTTTRTTRMQLHPHARKPITPIITI
jgi:hypothetical protein